MKREIKFRAKPNDPSAWGFDWVYGYYYEDLHDETARSVIVTPYPWFEHIDVIKNTLGEYTGLKDSKRTEKFPKGQEIYEGDVVKVVEENYSWYRMHYKKKFLSAMVVEFSCGSFRVKGEEFGYEGEGLINLTDCEVIGNIYENPELLKDE